MSVKKTQPRLFEELPEVPRFLYKFKKKWLSDIWSLLEMTKTMTFTFNTCTMCYEFITVRQTFAQYWKLLKTDCVAWGD